MADANADLAIILEFDVGTTERGYLEARCDLHGVKAHVATLKKGLAWQWRILALRLRDRIEKAMRSPAGDRVIAVQICNRDGMIFGAIPASVERQGLAEFRRKNG